MLFDELNENSSDMTSEPSTDEEDPAASAARKERYNKRIVAKKQLERQRMVSDRLFQVRICVF